MVTVHYSINRRSKRLWKLHINKQIIYTGTKKPTVNFLRGFEIVTEDNDEQRIRDKCRAQADGGKDLHPIKKGCSSPDCKHMSASDWWTFGPHPLSLSLPGGNRAVDLYPAL